MTAAAINNDEAKPPEFISQVAPREKVLLVDDDPTQLKLNFMRLRQAGFSVVTAASAEEGMQKARQRHPDVIMSDVVMGGIDGFSFCRLLREDTHVGRVPVILMSGHYGGEKERQLASQVGASALVARTPDFALELETLDQTLREGPAAVPTLPDAAVYEQQLWSANTLLTAAVAEARRAEQRYRALFDHAADMILLLTPEGIVIECNRRSEDILGIPADLMIGRHVREFASEDQEQKLTVDYHESVRRGEDRRVVPIRRVDGSVRHVEFSTNSIELDGEPRVLSVGRDVTETRLLEDGLRQAQKIEAIGQLTGGIAHDFNNILAVIVTNSELLMEDLAAGDARRDDVDQIRIAAHRAATLTRQLLAFGRKQVLAPTVVDLNVTIGGLEKMLRRVIGEDLALTFVPASDLGKVRADAGQVEQVVMNLVVNARDAMPQGGQLRIETSNLDLDGAYTDDGAPIPAGRYVAFAVSDTGTGMDAETKRRAFEPFFTTKKVGKGTGLGLSTSFGIVTQSGGTISVHSELGRGTTFTIYLPRVDADVAPAKTVKTMIDLRGTETVLLVEDDPSVSAAMTRILRGYGYRVLPARDGIEAIGIAKRQDAGIDLVLCDVVTPGPSGPEAVGEVQKSWPHAKVLYMSGYADHAFFHDGHVRTGTQFIQKPFAPDALGKKVRLLLEA